MERRSVIGVLGGVGPYAGIDLVRKIFDQTMADSDQEHLPVVLMSFPGEVEDRTGFLAGAIDRNPAHALAAILGRLEEAGATVAGIPCNTAHAPAIFGTMEQLGRDRRSELRVLHMILETASFIESEHPRMRTVGLLGTTGTVRSAVYQDALARRGLRVIVPDDARQAQAVHPAIYDTGYGVKARSNPVTARARELLLDSARWLARQGAEGIILGCTEIPLALPEASLDGLPLLDPTLALARALIRASYPERLRPLTG